MNRETFSSKIASTNITGKRFRFYGVREKIHLKIKHKLNLIKTNSSELTMQFNFEGNNVSISKIPTSFFDLKCWIQNSFKIDADKNSIMFRDNENELILLRNQGDFNMMMEIMKGSIIYLEITQSIIIRI
jgi:hypothetical protein